MSATPLLLKPRASGYWRNVMKNIRVRLSQDIAKHYSNLTDGGKKRIFFAKPEMYGDVLTGATLKIGVSSIYLAYGAGEFEVA